MNTPASNPPTTPCPTKAKKEATILRQISDDFAMEVLISLEACLEAMDTLYCHVLSEKEAIECGEVQEGVVYDMPSHIFLVHEQLKRTRQKMLDAEVRHDWKTTW